MIMINKYRNWNYKIMQYQNQIYLKKIQEQQQLALREVQTYYNAALIQHASLFEKRAKAHGKYLEFEILKLKVKSTIANYQDRPVKILGMGTNQNIRIKIKIIRILHYSQFLLCLALDEILEISDRYHSLVLVFPSSELAKKWSQQHGFLTNLQIYQPFVCNKSVFKPFLVITSINNINVLSSNIINVCRTSNQIKLLANQLFKKGSWIQAIYIYEIAIGLLRDSQSTKERAVLYANSAQCFFLLRLFQNCLIYAEAATLVEPTYVKSSYRKLCALLQLQQSNKIPQVLLQIQKNGKQKEFKEAEVRYIRFMSNNAGMFNWIQIFSQPEFAFNQYLNPKVKIAPDDWNRDKQNLYYTADKNIKKYELIAVLKPLAYAKVKLDYQKHQSLYIQLAMHLMKIYKMEKRFTEKLRQVIRTIDKNIGVSYEEIYSKICNVSYKKSISPKSFYSNGGCIGIWPQFFLFKHQCKPNCSYVRIQGAIFVFALRNISIGQQISIDYAVQKTTKRQQIFRERQITKMDCECKFCSWNWNFDKSYPSILLSNYFKNKAGLNEESCKIYMEYLKQIAQIKQKPFSESISEKAIGEIAELLKYQPQWESICNVIEHVHCSKDQQIRIKCAKILHELFTLYLKCTNSELIELFKLMFSD